MHPVLFSLGTIPVHSYYVLWTVALTLAVLWSRRRMESFGIDEERASSVILWALLGMYAGARLGSLPANWDYFSAAPWRFFSPFEGGLAAVPAFFGAGLAGFIRLRKLQVPLAPVAEAASLPAALTIAIGRWGCFLNGCCYGVVTDHSWGVHFPSIQGDAADVLRHPSQIYESTAGFVLLFVLWFLERFRGKEAPREAILWPLFMVGYGLFRFSADWLRHENSPDPNLFVFGMEGFTFLLGAGWLLYSLYRLSTHRKVSVRTPE